MTLSTFLKQPFVYLKSDKERWMYITSASIFFMFFLVIYQPFGISGDVFDDPETTLLDIILIISVESLSTFLVLMFSQFYLRKVLWKKNEITNEKYLGFFVFESFLVSLFIYLLYVVYYVFNPGEFEEEGYNVVLYILEAFEVGVGNFLILSYPFLINILIAHVKKLNTEVSELEKLIERAQEGFDSGSSEIETEIRILDENGNADLTLNIRELLFLEADNQYIHVHYLKDNIYEKKIVRTRLKKVLSELDGFPILKSHRSYVANLLNVDGFKNQNQKTYLAIKKFDDLKVPVSKTYLARIRKDLLKP